jgi:exopolysaccharide production protein ExoQ
VTEGLRRDRYLVAHVANMRHPMLNSYRKCTSGMPKFMNREQQSNGTGLLGATVLAIIPVFAIFYVLLILPFVGVDGKDRVENILFWPVAAGLVLTLLLLNWARIDSRFFRSLPILSLIAYLLFAAASITWAYNPELAFNRLLLQVLVFIVIVVPFALPVRTKYTMQGVHICYTIALAVSAVYVLTTPPSPIGHPGYFTHKQDLGLLGAIGIILSIHELLHRGSRRLVGLIAIGLGFWLVFESQSKSTLALSLIAMPCSWLILVVCKKTRLTPAYIVAAFVVASMFVSNPIERIGYRLYGDATLTGRTGIWGFVEYQISHKAWFGWGFHSYYFVPNSPHEAAPGYIREMPSSHSGYLELRLETGRIGYWIFMVFIYASLHLLEYVRRKDPVRAWCYLSIQLFAVMINLLDSNWLVLTHFWLLYLIIVAESIHYSWPVRASSPAPAASVREVTPMRTSRRHV